MAKIKVSVYEFTDQRTGEVFTGTTREYADSKFLSQGCVNGRVQRGWVTKKFIDGVTKERKNIERFLNIYHFANKETGVTFEGTRAQYCEKEGISESALGYRIKKGIISKIKIGREDDFEFVKKRQYDKERQIARKQYREKIMHRAFLQDIGEL